MIRAPIRKSAPISAYYTKLKNRPTVFKKLFGLSVEEFEGIHEAPPECASIRHTKTLKNTRGLVERRKCRGYVGHCGLIERTTVGIIIGNHKKGLTSEGLKSHF